MGQLTLAIREFKEKLNPFGLLVGLDKMDVKKARRLVLDSKKKKLDAKKALIKLNIAISQGRTDEIVKEYKQICDDFEKIVSDDAASLEKIIQMARREFLKLKELKKNSPNNMELSVMAMKKFYVQSQKWFKQLQQRQDFVLYMSDVESKEQEILHILDPFNLQRDVKKVRSDLAKSIKEARKAGSKKKISAKTVSLCKKINERLNADLDNELDKLNIIWNSMVQMMQLEMNEFYAESRELITKLEQLGFPRGDLARMHEVLKETDKRFANSAHSLESQMNGLIREEMST